MSLDLKGYKGFKILKDDHSLEANRLSIFCLMNKIPLLRSGDIRTKEGFINLKADFFEEDYYIPCGSVEWCEQLLGYHVKPDYYPEWAEGILHRKVWESNEWVLGRKLFVKPSDRYKRFTGFVTTGTYSKKKKPPFWYSEVVSFKNEWRYYVTNGKVVASGWYWGDEVNTPDAPEITLCIPSNYSGAFDCGDYNGSITLVESNHPFACGWYGKQEDDEKYFQWLIDGWIYMRGLK